MTFINVCINWPLQLKLEGAIKNAILMLEAAEIYIFIH